MEEENWYLTTPFVCLAMFFLMRILGKVIDGYLYYIILFFCGLMLCPFIITYFMKCYKFLNTLLETISEVVEEAHSIGIRETLRKRFKKKIVNFFKKRASNVQHGVNFIQEKARNVKHGFQKLQNRGGKKQQENAKVQK